MEDRTKVELLEAEKEMVNDLLKSLTNFRVSLGILREDFLSREKKLIEDITTVKETFSTKLQTLAESKGLDKSEEWQFDLTSLSFVKIQGKEQDEN